MSIDIGTLYAKIDADTKPLDRAQGRVSAFAKKAGIALAGVFAASKVAGFAKNATAAAARYDELGVAMYAVGKNAGYNKSQLDALEGSLRKTGISMLDTRQNISRLIQANIDLGKATDLARISQDAAVIAGLDSSETYTRLINGIQRGEVELLKTIGINVQFQEAYKKMARELGVATTSLTEYQKVQARTNIVMEAGADIAGAYEAAMETPGKKMRTVYGRLIKDIKVITGLLGMPIYKEFADWAYDAAKALRSALDEEKLKSWGKTIKNAVINPIRFLKDAIGGVIADIQRLDRAIADMLDQDDTPLKNIFESLKGWAAVIDGDLSLKDFLGMNPQELDAFFDRMDKGIVDIDNKIADLQKKRKQFQVWNPDISRNDALGGMANIDAEIAKLEKARERLSSGIHTKLIVDASMDFESADFWENLPIPDRVVNDNKAQLDKIREQLKDHADKVREINDAIADNQLRGAERLRSMKRSGMDDFAAWKDLKAEAGEYARLAEQAIDAGNFDKAVEYASSAEDKYAALNQEVKRGDKTLVSQAKALQTAMQGVEQMVNLQTKAMEGLKAGEMSEIDKLVEAAKKLDQDFEFDGINELKESMSEAADKSVEFGNALDTINEGPLEVMRVKGTEVWVNGEKAAVKAIGTMNKGLDVTISKLDRIRQLFQGMEGIQISLSGGGSIDRLRDGGAVGSYPILAQRGRYFPGFGGGDKIPILGEAGEYMINKFAVRDAGVETAAAFNQGDWDTVINNLSRKMSGGGYVGQSQPQRQSGEKESVVNMHFPGMATPVSIRATQKNARRMFKAWQEHTQR